MAHRYLKIEHDKSRNVFIFLNGTNLCSPLKVNIAIDGSLQWRSFDKEFLLDLGTVRFRTVRA